MTAPLDLPLELGDLARRASASAEVIEQTIAAEDSLFQPGQSLPPEILFGLAARVAAMQGSTEIAAWHIDQGADEQISSGGLPDDARLRTLVEHVDLITISPALTTGADQDRLREAGAHEDDIVLVSQLVAFMSFQIRLLHAYQLITGATPTSATPLRRRTRAEGRQKDLSEFSSAGFLRPTQYTQEILAWDPWISAPSEEELTEIQRDSFAAKTTSNSVYFRLLSRAPGILKARSAVDNAIFLPGSELSRADRELAAAAASKVNDCIYCASVHSRKASFQSKRPAEVQRLLDAELPRDERWQPTELAPLGEGQDARWHAVIDFSAHLSTLVPSAQPHHVEALRAEGFSDRELSDLAGAAAFFAWANRLMLTLGEAYVPRAG